MKNVVICEQDTPVSIHGFNSKKAEFFKKSKEQTKFRYKYYTYIRKEGSNSNHALKARNINPELMLTTLTYKWLPSGSEPQNRFIYSTVNCKQANKHQKLRVESNLISLSTSSLQSRSTPKSLGKLITDCSTRSIWLSVIFYRTWKRMVVLAIESPQLHFKVSKLLITIWYSWHLIGWKW